MKSLEALNFQDDGQGVGGDDGAGKAKGHKDDMAFEDRRDGKSLELEL